MSIQSSEKGGIFNEINITPLTDIFLVLLIIMMVLAPMFQAVEKNIKMPGINNGQSVDNDKVIISVTKNNEFFVNGEPVLTEALESKLASLVKIAKEKTVVVKADTDVKNKEIMKIIRSAQAAGYEKLVVAGEPLTKKQQDDLRNNALDSSQNADLIQN